MTAPLQTLELSDGLAGQSLGAAPCSPLVAALFVQADGCYSELQWVEAWPKERDARLYNGPLPVVAHPPCQRYGNLGIANYARWGGEHNRPMNDGGCFAAALAAVNCWGGVLEHPANSRAWPAYNLNAPERGKWTQSGIGWVCEVWQSAYGHRATKRTWLYWRGEGQPEELDWSQPIGTHQVGFQDQRGKDRNKPTLSPREANATPIRFRDALLRLACMANAQDVPTASTATPQSH